MKFVIAILVFSVIILFHEFGHLLLAKKNGIKVVEFSIGLGPTLFGKTINGTKYSVKLLPFGGACQMFGEDFDTETVEEGSFYSKSVWQRMSVILAGPFFNFILAFILALVVIGFAGYDPSTVTNVQENSAAAQAGLQAGDTITKLGNSRISIGRQLDTYMMYTDFDGAPLKLQYKRDGVVYNTTITPSKLQKYLLGFTYNATESEVVISAVSGGYPMEKAGIKAGDVITAIDGKTITSGTQLSTYFSECPLNGTPVIVSYVRDNIEYSTVVTPQYRESYSLGFSYNLMRTDANPIEVVKYSFVEVGYWIQVTIKNLGMLFGGKLSTDDIGGAVAIVDIIGDSYEETKAVGTAFDVVLQMLYMIILLSANLGVMNLLPVPALDGGKFLLLVVEAIKGKPLNRKLEGLINMVGFILLMLLMVFVFFNDIRRLFR